jgi:hypothetical protein
MSAILFLTFVIIVVTMLVVIMARATTRKPVRKATIALLFIVCVYVLYRFAALTLRTDVAVPMGTDVCFDDWCATVMKADTAMTLGEGANLMRPSGRFIILHVRMSNQARGIAQKPSDPRIFIIDGKGYKRTFSEVGQQALEQYVGKQVDLGARLELHQSLETQVVFDVPRNAKDLKAVIEEGPFIANFLLAGDRDVFRLH